MHNTDDLDAAWDNLDSEFGLDTDAQTTKPELREQAPPPVSKLVDETPIADEDEPDLHGGALFDPGPDQVLEDTDHVNVGATDEEFDDTDSPELFDTEATPVGEFADAGEGGKRKRKRRRRKKKKGDPNAVPGEATTADDSVTEATVPDDDIVEEGEAPSEIVDDEDEVPIPTSAVDEELVAVANQPKQEWNVMTWADLIGKLHRPG